MFDFVVDHPNIAASQHFHSSGGVVLRPPSVPDWELPAADEQLYMRIAERGLEVSGYNLATNVYDWNWPRGSSNRMKVARNRAKKVFEDFTAKSARFLEAGLDLAGLDDLVGIVRPGVGRRGRPASKTKLDATAPRDGRPAGDEPKALSPRGDQGGETLPAPSADEPKALSPRGDQGGETLPAPPADEPDEPDNL